MRRGLAAIEELSLPAAVPLLGWSDHRVCCSPQDDMVYTDEIREWGKQTRSRFDLIEVDGDHWFLNRNRDRILATLQEISASAMATTVQTASAIGRRWCE